LSIFVEIIFKRIVPYECYFPCGQKIIAMAADDTTALKFVTVVDSYAATNPS